MQEPVQIFDKSKNDDLILKADQDDILNSETSDLKWRHYIREAGVNGKTDKYKPNGQNLVFSALKMYFRNELRKDFSKKHDDIEIEEDDKPEMTIDQKKKSKAKVMVSFKD